MDGVTLINISFHFKIVKMSLRNDFGSFRFQLNYSSDYTFTTKGKHFHFILSTIYLFYCRSNEHFSFMSTLSTLFSQHWLHFIDIESKFCLKINDNIHLMCKKRIHSTIDRKIWLSTLIYSIYTQIENIKWIWIRKRVEMGSLEIPNFDFFHFN